MSTTTNLNTLVINYLTEAQYEAAVSGGTIDPDQLYLTPATNVPTYTAGSGIDITNGVISLDVPNGNAISYGLTDGTLPLVGVGKAGSMEV